MMLEIALKFNEGTITVKEVDVSHWVYYGISCLKYATEGGEVILPLDSILRIRRYNPNVGG